MALADFFNVTVDEMLRDLTPQERARLLLRLDLPSLRKHLEEAAAAIEIALRNASGVEGELGLGARLAELTGHRSTKVLIHMMSDEGLTVTHHEGDDGRHTITGIDAETDKTHTATHADLRKAVCEEARAAGFELGPDDTELRAWEEHKADQAKPRRGGAAKRKKATKKATRKKS